MYNTKRNINRNLPTKNLKEGKKLKSDMSKIEFVFTFYDREEYRKNLERYTILQGYLT